MLGLHIGKQPYVQWQQAFDPLLTPGGRNYSKTQNFTDLHVAVIDHVVSLGAILPTAECEFYVSHLAGAPNRVPPDATAYCQRDARFVMNIHGRWQNPDQDESIVNWARTAFEACAPLASSGAYVNFMTEDEQGRIEHAYGINHHKLQRIKHQYDPDNLLHLNPNITPRVAMQDSLASPDEKPGQIATA